MTWQPRDPLDSWIASVADGAAFADVGGIGEDSTNERVSAALHNGARAATMVDIRPLDFHQWPTFRTVMAEKGLEGRVEEIAEVDVNDPRLPELMGRHDIVNCTGIFYHLPAPLLALQNLERATGRHLIVNTVVVPRVIENAAGTLRFEGSQALFLPGISEAERDVLRVHYETKFGWSIDNQAPRLEQQAGAIMPWREDGEFSCWPYWWLFTAPAFRAAVELLGFRVIDEWTWEDHAYHVFAERRPEGEDPQEVAPRKPSRLGWLRRRR